MKKLFLQLTILIFTTTVLLSGCTSIVSKTASPVYFHIDPKGANISVTDKRGKVVFNGISPATVTLQSGAGYFSKAEYEVKLSSPGFAEKVVYVKYKLNGWYFGNLLLGGVIGMLIVDPATGAMWKVSDPVVDETLVKATASATSIPTLNIVSIKDIPGELKHRLVKVN